MVAIKRVEAELPIPDLCRELGISTATFYKWRSKFGGIDTSMMSRMKELEDIFNERYPRLTLTIDHMDLSELQTGCPIQSLALLNEALAIEQGASSGPTRHPTTRYRACMQGFRASMRPAFQGARVHVWNVKNSPFSDGRLRSIPQGPHAQEVCLSLPLG